ncbi:NAD(P)H-dependent oxidoreductase subunit E [Sulfobacillus thermosulfidooxidans]|uniref:NADH-quinone oxidoreductase subunit NuoE family protein n=1 Tax=Sulfobacillus thermosulfidooxidans TaxID=28034 RepID=UPI001592B754|nr:NAD(P)H-dependent oxidoreductase subunit E [Sulfobacillus thermosulfidooxidans]
MNDQELPVAIKVEQLLESIPKTRDQLLPALWRVYDHFHYLNPDIIGELSRQMAIPYAEVYGVASFYALFSWEQPARVPVQICHDVICQLYGAEALSQKVAAGVDPQTVRVTSTLCLGQCDHAPAALVGDHVMRKATVDKIQSQLEGGQA